MWTPFENDNLPAFDQDFSIDDWSTAVEISQDDEKYKDALRKEVRKLGKLQEALFADGRYSVLTVFQAMDAAGKDSTIRHVFSGVNPAGCVVRSFKKPSDEELNHDYLWRTTKRMPERGKIGVFNRSYYEEVLVVNVHPDILDYQRLPYRPDTEAELWQSRYESIANFEEHMARNGTIILKFWLNVSQDEQARRFLSRLEENEKNWKFNQSDLSERALWPRYMQAYETVINATHKSHAPWYVIPADNKPYMRYLVARIIRKTLQALPLRYPELDSATLDKKDDFIMQLKAELKESAKEKLK